VLGMFSGFTGIPREAKLLIYASLLPALAYGMFYTDVAYFLTAVQGIDPLFMGALITMMGVSTFIVSIPLGALADRYGRKKLLIMGNIISAADIAIFALTTEPLFLIMAALAEGISESGFMAASGAMMAEKAGDANRTKVFALQAFATGIAFGLGSFIIPVVVVFEGMGFSSKDSHVILYVILALAALASTYFMLKVSESKTLKTGKFTLRNLVPQKSRGTVLKYTTAGAIIAFGAGMVVPLMTYWLHLAYGIPDSVSGPIIGISNILIGVANLAAPPLARRIGLVKSIVLTQVISTVFMVATPLSASWIAASSVWTVRTFLMNMANPLQQSMIMGLVSPEERGVASGISGALWRLPNALSTTVGAGLMAAGFLGEPFFLAGGLYVVSISLFWAFFRRTKMPEEIVQKL
jgi:MFS family permease